MATKRIEAVWLSVQPGVCSAASHSQGDRHEISLSADRDNVSGPYGAADVGQQGRDRDASVIFASGGRQEQTHPNSNSKANSKTNPNPNPNSKTNPNLHTSPAKRPLPSGP
jgi:hypothetical protein